jgi:integrase
MQYCQGEHKRPKYGSDRTLPILPELDPLLKEYRLQSKSMSWVFPGIKGKPMIGDSWVHRHFKRILKRHNLPDVKFHSLRHLFDTTMHNAGVSTWDIMQMMGHKSTQMTLAVYDRPSPDHLVRVTKDLRLLGYSARRKSIEN